MHLPIFLCYTVDMTLKQLISIQYDTTHVVLFIGQYPQDSDTPVFDGLAKDIDLGRYGDYIINFIGGAADQPIGMQYWISESV